MVQCEVLLGEMLGGQPADEDPTPGPGDIPQNGPLDFFGFRSEWAAPFGQQGQQPQMGPQPNPFAGPNNAPQDLDAQPMADDVWAPWQNNEVSIQAPMMDLNGLPLNLAPDLNVEPVVDMAEVIIDPPVIP